jgi:hypothetical protein
MASGNDLLMNSGGTPWAKFPQPGTTVVGDVIGEPEARQRTDFDDGTPLTWPNGDPRMEVVVKLQTTERDPEIQDDDGVRALHMYGNMLAAVRDAVKATKAAGLQPGGRLAVTYTGDGEARGKSKAPKLYRAQYAVPAGGGNEVLMGQGNGHQATTTTAAHPTAQLADMFAPAVVPACPQGVDPATWAAMQPGQRAAVLAALGQPAAAGAPGF